MPPPPYPSSNGNPAPPVTGAEMMTGSTPMICLPSDWEHGCDEKLS